MKLVYENCRWYECDTKANFFQDCMIILCMKNIQILCNKRAAYRAFLMFGASSNARCWTSVHLMLCLWKLIVLLTWVSNNSFLSDIRHIVIILEKMLTVWRLVNDWTVCFHFEKELFLWNKRQSNTASTTFIYKKILASLDASVFVLWQTFAITKAHHVCQVSQQYVRLSKVQTRSTGRYAQKCWSLIEVTWK